MDLATLSVAFDAKGTSRVVQDASSVVKTLADAEKASQKLTKSWAEMNQSLSRGVSSGKGTDFISTISKLSSAVQNMERQFKQFQGFKTLQSQITEFGKLSAGFGNATTSMSGKAETFRRHIVALENAMKTAGKTGSLQGLYQELSKLDNALTTLGTNKRGVAYKSDQINAMVTSMREGLNRLAAESLRGGEVAAANFNRAMSSFGLDTKNNISTRIKGIIEEYRTLKNAFASDPAQLKLATDIFHNKLAEAKQEYQKFLQSVNATSGKSQAPAAPSPIQASLLRNQQIIAQQVPAGAVYHDTFGGQAAGIQKAFEKIETSTKKAEVTVKQSSAGMRESLVKPLNDWAILGRRSSATIQEEINKVKAAYDRLRQSGLNAADANNATRGQQKRLEALQKELKESSRDPNALSTKFNDIISQVAGAKSLFQIFTNTALYSTAYNLLNVLMQIPGAVLDINIKMESLKKSFEGVFGSAEAGARHFQYIMDTANKFGKDIESVAGGYRKFSAATDFVGMSAKESQRIFEAVTAAITKMGGSSDDVGGTLTALTQMISKGTVSAEEFRLQFAERIPGAMKMGADAMGVTVAQFKELMKAGDLDSIDFLGKFVPQLEKFGTGWEKAADTVAANIERMKNSFMQLASSESISEVLNAGAKFATSIMDSATEHFKKSDKYDAMWKAFNDGLLSYTDMSKSGVLDAKFYKQVPGFEWFGNDMMDMKSVDAMLKRVDVYKNSMEQALKQKEAIEQMYKDAASSGKDIDSGALSSLQKAFMSNTSGQKIIEGIRDQIKALVEEANKARVDISPESGHVVEENMSKVRALEDYLAKLTGTNWRYFVDGNVNTNPITNAIALIQEFHKLTNEGKAMAASADLEKTLKTANDLSQKIGEIEATPLKSTSRAEQENKAQQLKTFNEDYRKLLDVANMQAGELGEANKKIFEASPQGQTAKLVENGIEERREALIRYGSTTEKVAAIHQKYLENASKYDAVINSSTATDKDKANAQGKLAAAYLDMHNATVQAIESTKKGGGAAERAAHSYETLLDSLRGTAKQLAEATEGNDLGSKLAEIDKKFDATMNKINNPKFKSQEKGEASYWAEWIRGAEKALAYKDVVNKFLPDKGKAEELKSISENFDKIAEGANLSREEVLAFRAALNKATNETELNRLQKLADTFDTLPEKINATQQVLDKLTERGGKVEQDTWNSTLKDWMENSQQMVSSRIASYDEIIAEAKRAGNEELAAFAQLGKEDALRKGLETKVKTGSPGEAFGARLDLEFETYKSYETRKREEAVRSADIMIGLTDDVSGAVASGIGDMIRGLASGTMNMEDIWKSFLASIVDAFASAIEEMIANWLKSSLAGLFGGSVSGPSQGTGTPGGVGGVGGIFSKLVEPAASSLFGGASGIFAGAGGIGSSVGASVGAGLGGAGGIFSGASSAVSGVASSVMGIAGGAGMGAAMGSVVPVIGTLIGAGIGILGGLLSQGEEKKKEPEEVWSGRSYMYTGGAMSGFKYTQMDDGSSKLDTIDPFELEKERREFKETAKSFSKSMKTLEIDFDRNWLRSFSFSAPPVSDELASSVQHVMMQNAGMQALGGLSSAVGTFAEGLENLIEVVARLGEAFGLVAPTLGPLGVDFKKMSATSDAVVMSYAALATGFNEGLAVIGQSVSDNADSAEELSTTLLELGAAGQRTVEYFETYRKQLTNLALAQYSELLIDAVGGEDAFKSATTVFSEYGMGDRERADSSISYYTKKFEEGLLSIDAMLPNFNASWIGDSTDAFWKAYSAAMKESMPPSMFAEWSDAAANVASLEEAIQSLADVDFAEWTWDEELKYRRQMADAQKAGAEMTRWGIELEQELADARKNGATYAQQISLVETQIYELQAKLNELMDVTEESDDLGDLTERLSKAVSYQITVLQDLAIEAYSTASAFESLGESLRDTLEAITDEDIMPDVKFIKERSKFNAAYKDAMSGFDEDAQEAMGKIADLAEGMLKSAKLSMSFEDYDVLKARTVSRLTAAASRSERQGEYGEVSGDLYTAQAGLLTRLQEELQDKSPDLSFVADANSLFSKMAVLSDAAKKVGRGEMGTEAFTSLAKSTEESLMTDSLRSLLSGGLDLASVDQNQARLLLSSVDTLEALEKYTGREIDLSDSMRLQLETIAAGVTDQSMWQSMIDQMETGREDYISWIKENIEKRKAEADRLYALEEKEQAAADQMLIYFSAMSKYLEKQTNLETISASIATLQSKASSFQTLAMMAMIAGVPMLGMMHMQTVTELNAQIAALNQQLQNWSNLPVAIPEFAAGGIVYERTLATIGEAGAEAVVPLSSGAIPVRINGNYGGGNDDLRSEIRELRQELVAVTRKVADNTGSTALHTFKTSKAIERSNYAKEIGA